MRALVKHADEVGLRLEDVPEPEVGINDVAIHVERAGICGTDVHIWEWNAWARSAVTPPLVVGHEFVGRIAAVGSNVTDFHPGDRVSGEGHVVCGRCRHCLAGRRHLCANSRGVGVQRPGAFADTIVLPVTNVWKHADDVDPEVAAIFDPFGNAVHTALSTEVLGEDILITGAGPIGCMAAAVVRHAGARFVVVSEPNPYRRALAEQMGATVVIDPTALDLHDVEAELGMVEGFDVGLEMSGNAAALRSMIDTMAHGGRIAMLGIPSEQFADRLEQGRVRHADDQGDLRPRDVRDLVPDDRDAPVGPRREAGDHAPLRGGPVRGGVRGRGLRRERQGPAGVGRRRLTRTTQRSCFTHIVISSTRCTPGRSGSDQPPR